MSGGGHSTAATPVDGGPDHVTQLQHGPGRLRGEHPQVKVWFGVECEQGSCEGVTYFDLPLTVILGDDDTHSQGHFEDSRRGKARKIAHWLLH